MVEFKLESFLTVSGLSLFVGILVQYLKTSLKLSSPLFINVIALVLAFGISIVANKMIYGNVEGGAIVTSFVNCLLVFTSTTTGYEIINSIKKITKKD